MPPIQPSASVAATGLGIRYVGEHCYAFSRNLALNSIQTMFDFTSGSGYIVATLNMMAAIRMTTDDITGGFNRGWQLDFNGESVGMYKADTSAEDMPTMIEAQILIPPFTAVVLTCVDSGVSANYTGTVTLTGRVYGAE